jgi:uncharacterized membrane protein YtjA (UPF0391 family)
MLYYAFVFLVISLIAGMLGFRSIESGASTIAKIFFFIFLALTILTITLMILGISIAL